MIRRLLPLAYGVAGGVIAYDHAYLDHLHTASQIVSAVLAILAWPLVLAGVNLHLHISVH
jgi:hypothetical protein